MNQWALATWLVETYLHLCDQVFYVGAKNSFIENIEKLCGIKQLFLNEQPTTKGKTAYIVSGLSPQLKEGDLLIYKDTPFAAKDNFKVIYNGNGLIIMEKEKASYTLGCGLIVKNEEKIIKRCLASVAEIVNLFCVFDTGSTDKTAQSIKEFCKENGFELITEKSSIDVGKKQLLYQIYLGASNLDENGNWLLWDFSKARNQYVELIDEHCDYTMSMDADDVFTANKEEVDRLLMLNGDVYSFFIQFANYKDFQFRHHRIWKSKKNIRYKGACHECPSWDNNSLKVIDTHHIIEHRPDHKSEPNVSRNLRILEKEYLEGEKHPRLLFYLGNSLREAGLYEKAINVYDEYLQNPSWYGEEVTAVLYKIRCQRRISPKDALKTAFAFLNKDSGYSEILMEVAYCYYNQKLYKDAIPFCYKAIQPFPKVNLFLEKNAYTDQPHRLLSFIYEQLDYINAALFHTKKVNELVPNDQDFCSRENNLKDRANKNFKSYLTSLDFQMPLGEPAKPIVPAPIPLHNPPIITEKPILNLLRPGAAGDVLMILPMMKELAEKYIIHFYTDEKFLPIVKTCPWVKQVYPYVKGQTVPSPSISLIGYPRSEGYPDKPMEKHLIEYFAAELGVSPTLDCKLDLGEFKPVLEQPYIAMQVKAGWSPYKDWPLNYYQRLVGYARSNKIPVVQVGAASDPRLKNVLDCCGKYNFIESMNIIKQSSCFIGGDSFGNHVTNINQKTKSVILWGSTSEIGSGYKHNKNISLNLKCSPCYREYPYMSVDPKGMCPHDICQSWEAPQHPCMWGISAEHVWEEVKTILSELHIL